MKINISNTVGKTIPESIVTFYWTPVKDEDFTLPKLQIITAYTPEYVPKIYNMFDRQYDHPYRKICVTDDPDAIRKVDPSIEVVPLWDKYRKMGGCFNRLYTFSSVMKELFGERFLCIDLDMMLVDNVTKTFERDEDFVIYKLHVPKDRYNGSMYMMNAGCREKVWLEFDKDAKAAKKAIDKSKIIGTDQAWIQLQLGMGEAYWDNKRDGVHHVLHDIINPRKKTFPEGAKILAWPGRRSPCESRWRKQFPWINQYYF